MESCFSFTFDVEMIVLQVFFSTGANRYHVNHRNEDKRSYINSTTLLIHNLLYDWLQKSSKFGVLNLNFFVINFLNMLVFNWSSQHAYFYHCVYWSFLKCMSMNCSSFCLPFSYFYENMSELLYPLLSLWNCSPIDHFHISE